MVSAINIPLRSSFQVPAFDLFLFTAEAGPSRALHDGTPFPDPMCGPAIQGGRLVEKPDSIATATKNAAWRSEDLPMLLHVFEHLTRCAIVNWWRSVADKSAVAAPPPQ